MTCQRWALRALAGVFLVLFVLAATVVAAVLRGVTIDVSRWRDAAATRLATVLERPASLQGPFTLTLGREATLHVGAVEIPAPSGFPSQEFAALNDVDVCFGLFEALRGSLKLHRIGTGSGRLRLERTADGRANWSFPQLSSASPPRELRVADLVLRNLDVEYVNDTARTHFRTAVDELAAQGCCNDALHVALRGRTAGESPYAVVLSGGALRPLLSAAAPWPFDFALEYADARLTASGTISADADVVEFTRLRGRLSDAEASGQLTADFRGVRPQLRGALALARLDAIASANGEGWQPTVATEARSVCDLIPLDLDIRVTAAALPGEVRDATVDLRADDGRLHAPLSATWAGIPVSGSVDLDTAAAVPSLAVRLEAKDAALRDLPADVVDGNALGGTLRRLGFSADASGETVAALIGDLQLRLSAAGRLWFERGSGAPPLALALDAFDMSVQRGARLRGSARGSLQGDRAAIEFQAGTLPEMLQRRTPIEADLTVARARLRASGVAAFPGTEAATDLAFDLRAPRAGDLARWLPVGSGAKLALDARGRVRIDDDGWRLDAESLKVGRSALSLEATRVTGGGTHPVTRVAARGRFIDLAELATLLPPPRANAPRPTELLPDALRGADMDVEFAADRVVWQQVDVEDTSLAARVRAGRIDPSPLAARFAGGRFHGVVAGDLSGASPDLDLQLAADSVDAGALLRTLGVTQQLTGKVEAIEASAQLRGSTLQELAQRSSLTASARGATLTMTWDSERPPVVMEVAEATLEARAGNPVQIRVSGSYDEESLAFQLATGRLEDLVEEKTRIPIVATGNAADTRLDVDGDILLPLGRGGRFRVDLGGDRLDRLNGLAGVELPAWGPWSIRSPFHMTAKRVDLPGMSVRIGTSTLKGAGKIDLTGPRPRLALDVTAPVIQLDDFPLPERLADDPEPTLTAAGLRATARGVARRTERLLNARFLQRFDVGIDAQVKEVLSGTDQLVDGHLRIQVDNGHLYLGPARVNLPGGTLTLALAYDPKPSEVDFKVGAYVERFDYGIIARRLRRGENVRGLISAQIDIASRGRSLDRIMQHADGRMDFAIWPEELGGGIFNLWSVNLLLAVLPVIDPGGASHVNCIVGRFDLRDGVVSDDKMLIDTTRVRVRGTGHANLGTEELDFVFRPRAKGLALFRLQYPLRVTGTLTDYNIGIDRRDIVPATLRMLASPILVPWERLTQGPLPRDGADVCTDPLRR